MNLNIVDAIIILIILLGGVIGFKEGAIQAWWIDIRTLGWVGEEMEL